jgi:hypothetical protein
MTFARDLERSLCSRYLAAMDIFETVSKVSALPGAVVDAAIALLHQEHTADALAPIEIDDGGWMHGDGVTRFRKGERDPSLPPGYLDETNKQQGLAIGLDHVEGIVTHWTDTRGCGASALARRLIDPRNTRAASWHAVIDAQGVIAQSVSARCGSWHAGGSSAALFARQSPGEWVPLAPAQRGKVRGYGANSWAYGIELECVGEVRLVGNEWLGWPFARGTEYGSPAVVPPDEVATFGSVIVNGVHVDRGYHRFSPAQLGGLKRVVSALVHRYGLRRDACSIGHCQIDPDNRTDPGPLMLGMSDHRIPRWGTAAGGELHAILDSIYSPK